MIQGSGRLGLTGVLTLLALSFGHAHALDVGGELGFRFEQNRTRAEAELDQRPDTAVVADVHGGHGWRLNPLTRIRIEGGLNGRRWTRFEDTSVLAVRLGVRARRLLDTDFQAPWLEWSAHLTGLVHQDSDIRDGGILRSGLAAGKRLSQSVSARVGYSYSIRRATQDVVFDTEQHDAFGQLDWSAGTRWLFYAELRATEGELTSVATLPNAKVRAGANHVTRDFDTSFERGPSPLGIGERPRWTYQLDGRVLSTELGFNYRLTRHWALDIAARYVKADAAGDNQYNGYIVNGGLLWQFN